MAGDLARVYMNPKLYFDSYNITAAVRLIGSLSIYRASQSSPKAPPDPAKAPPGASLAEPGPKRHLSEMGPKTSV